MYPKHLNTRSAIKDTMLSQYRKIREKGFWLVDRSVTINGGEGRVGMTTTCF